MKGMIFNDDPQTIKEIEEFSNKYVSVDRAGKFPVLVFYNHDMSVFGAVKQNGMVYYTFKGVLKIKKKDQVDVTKRRQLL